MIKIELGALIIAMCIVGYALYSYLDKRLRKVERTLYGDEYEDKHSDVTNDTPQDSVEQVQEESYEDSVDEQ